jgi:hypothetical protein
MDFIHGLLVSENAIRPVDEDEVLVLVVSDPCHVVEREPREPGDDWGLVHGVERSDEDSLLSVLHVHVVVVVAVPYRFEAPVSSILGLEGDLGPHADFREPLEGGCSVVGVDLEGVPHGVEGKNDACKELPHPHPLSNSSVLVNHFSLLEAEWRIRIHGRGLHEGLELVSRMVGRKLKAKDLFERWTSEDGVSESIGDMGELLLLGPLDIVLMMLLITIMVVIMVVVVMIVVVVMPMVLQVLQLSLLPLKVNLLGLGLPASLRWFKFIVKWPEFVVKVYVHSLRAESMQLIELLRDVRGLSQIRSDLRDM